MTRSAAIGLHFALPDYLVDALQEPQERPAEFQRRPRLDPADAGRFVIGQDGTILYAEVNPDYTRRPEPEDMIPVLEKVAVVHA